MNHDMSRSAIEYGPYEADEMPCQRDGCEYGQVPASTFAKHATRDCEECGGEGVISVNPDEWDDYRDHDPIDLYDEVDFG